MRKTNWQTALSLSLFGLIAACSSGGGSGGAGGGAGGQSGAQCRKTSDCPPTGSECIEVACVAGFCGENDAPVGTKCGMGQGTCDASAECVECVTNADCPAKGVDAECASVICNAGTCETVPKAVDTPCSTGLCDQTGTCTAQCNAAAQCTSAKACNVPACVQGVCSETPGPDGAMCNWNDLPIATCKAGDCRVCEDTACDSIDTHESNDTQATAYDLGAHTDCDHYGFCAALTDGDVDWYTYQGSDTFGCNVAPSVDFDAPHLQVCQYWSCDSVPTVSTCPDGTTPDTAPGGQPGCCSTSAFSYDPCNGGLFDSEDAHVWIKVTRTSGSGCEPYALGVEF